MADCFQQCRFVEEFEKLNRVGEGTYGVVCKLFFHQLFIFKKYISKIKKQKIFLNE